MEPEATLTQLNAVLRHCQKAPFYRNRALPDSLPSLEDWQHLPLTSRDDLLTNSPFAMLCVPQAELAQYHESFGTSGHPVSVWLTEPDFAINVTALSRWGVEFQPNDMVMVRFPYSNSLFAHSLTAAAQQQGACVVPAGSRSTVTPFPRVINLLRKLNVTVLACLPLQALLLAEAAESLNFEPRKDFPDLRAICTTGEVLAPGRRKTLERIWGVPVFDSYGLTEMGTVAVECKYQRSHPLEADFYIEILGDDLASGVKPGETGNLVITTLKRRGMPFIRYLTGDRARWVPEKCACGAAASLEIRGRIANVIKVNNHNLDLWDMEELIAQLPWQRFWAAAPTGRGVAIVVEETKTADVARARADVIDPVRLKSLGKAPALRFVITVVPQGTLYNRKELLATGVVGKPQYIYTAQEMAAQKYLKSVRL